ncbi:MAG: BaiN/RdsA family NAD(P)/FAD-dependent oxidoreductase [Thermoanaerobaculia bacterium]
MERVDIAVIGAGAAGMMAALFAARSAPGARVVALDGATRPGAKILIAGGGRCNVTHDVVTPDDFNGANRNQIAKVLRSFDVESTIEFFRDAGVVLKREEGGKLFPVTDRAHTVLEALLRALARSGAELRCGFRVESLRREGERFLVESHGSTIDAGAVVLATGGRSVPKTGSDGFGYELASSLGHSVRPTFPALVPLLLEKGHWMTELRGISVDAEVQVVASGGRILHRERESLLFAHFGLTGPVVFDISRHWIAARLDDPGVRLLANFLGADFSAAEQLFRSDPRRSGTTVRSILRSRFPDRLADALAMEGAGVDPETPLTRLAREGRRGLAHALTELALPVTGDRGFGVAEVTAGGVPLDELRLATMESRITPRLHLCGEILDVDGRIGGYNFQWAWASGRLAGEGAARSHSG